MLACVTKISSVNSTSTFMIWNWSSLLNSCPFRFLNGAPLTRWRFKSKKVLLEPFKLGKLLHFLSWESVLEIARIQDCWRSISEALALTLKIWSIVIALHGNNILSPMLACVGSVTPTWLKECWPWLTLWLRKLDVVIIQLPLQITLNSKMQLEKNGTVGKDFQGPTVCERPWSSS